MARPVICLLGLFLLAAACGDDGASSFTSNAPPLGPVTPVARPPGVPSAAQAVEATTTLGDIVRRARQTPEQIETRLLHDATCADGVLRLATSEETIYAALPCDRFWDDAAKSLFVNQDTAIVLEAGMERLRILIETVAGAQAEFTVGGIWVE